MRHGKQTLACFEDYNSAVAGREFFAKGFEISLQIYGYIVSRKIAEEAQGVNSPKPQRSSGADVKLPCNICQNGLTVEQEHEIINRNNAAPHIRKGAKTKAHFSASVDCLTVNKSVGLSESAVIFMVAFVNEVNAQTDSSLKFIVRLSWLKMSLRSLTPAALNIRLEALVPGVSAYLSER